MKCLAMELNGIGKAGQLSGPQSGELGYRVWTVLVV